MMFTHKCVSFTDMHETVKHSNEHTFVGMDENLYEAVSPATSQTVSGFVSAVHHAESHTVLLLCAEYSKRVYQGVRVKHTVKDLLAEKRSRQTNGPRYSVSTTSSQPLCFRPIVSLPSSFFSQTKQRSHS